MSPKSQRNVALVLLLVVGLVTATLIDSPKDPVRPYLLVLGALLVAKVNLEFLLGLPMGITFPVAMPGESTKRRNALISSWGILGLFVYGYLAW